MLNDLAIAVAIGVPLFVVLIWLPATSGDARTTAQSRERFNHATLVLLAVGAGLGIASITVGIVAQAAAEANVSFWSALDADRISAILGTRVGAVSGIRAGLFAVLTLVALALIMLVPYALMALIALGALSRQRVLPAIRSAVAAAGGAGSRQGTRILTRVGRLETALLAGVVIAAGLLVGYAPPVTPSFDPYLATTHLGDADMQITVAPARAGVNHMDVYLLGRDGRPYEGVYELDMDVDLPAKGVGPLPVTAPTAPDIS
jgi:hypothetical protein